MLDVVGHPDSMIDECRIRVELTWNADCKLRFEVPNTGEAFGFESPARATGTGEINGILSVAVKWLAVQPSPPLKR